MEPCGNRGGPSPKAKYKPATDSELVPRGKGEKNPGEGSEIVPETVCLQAVEELLEFLGFALFIPSSTACLLHNESASYFVLQG